MDNKTIRCLLFFFFFLLFAGMFRSQDTLRVLIFLDSNENGDSELFGKVYKNSRKKMSENLRSFKLTKETLKKIALDLKEKRLDSLASLFNKKLTCRLKGDTLELSFPSKKNDSLRIKFMDKLYFVFITNEFDVMYEKKYIDKKSMEIKLDSQFLRLRTKRSQFIDACNSSVLFIEHAHFLIGTCKNKMTACLVELRKEYPGDTTEIYKKWNDGLTFINRVFIDSGYHYSGPQKIKRANSVYFFYEYFTAHHTILLEAIDSLKKKFLYLETKKMRKCGSAKLRTCVYLFRTIFPLTHSMKFMT